MIAAQKNTIPTDFTYHAYADGFVAVYPETPNAVATVTKMIEALGSNRLLPHEFRAFRLQARAAGYSVRKAAPVRTTDAELLSLLSELG